MRIRPETPAGRRLLSWGVTATHLGRTRIFGWDLQRGGAITIALPLRLALIPIRRRYLVRDAQGELADGPHLALIRHEFCHVQQNSEWGFLGYWRRHLLARLRSRSLLAAESDVEAPCYEAQRHATADFARPTVGGA
ncbi:MAG: hypothetical protein HY678_03425 [Chloroflexi bacterium]|nr:hypothetical protein [Chloroflexota bacterium]